MAMPWFSAVRRDFYRTIPRSFRRRLKHLLLVQLILVLCVLGFWQAKYNNFLGGTSPQLQLLERRISEFRDSVEKNEALGILLESALNTKKAVPKLLSILDVPNLVIPVLVIACNRVSVRRNLDALLLSRKSLIGLSPSVFPITVSQGCSHDPTTKVLTSYGDQINVIRFNDNEKPGPNVKQSGYSSVARHYKFALDHMLMTLNHSAVIVVEDDLDVAPDFLDYFAATYPLLLSDPSLFCVSAWNDNGRPELVDPTRNDLIYRCDFFPGLGWMMLRSFWLEIRDQWPSIYWDEYVRKDYVRKNRSCLRPEIGRTTTFGKHGISRGQYYEKFLKTMLLNKVKYNFLEADLTYLYQPGYSKRWHRRVYDECTGVNISDFLRDNFPGHQSVSCLRVTYTTRKEFESVARHCKLMDDFKSGVMRNGFEGVVPIYWMNYEMYIAPPPSWTHYDMSWV
ncbi:unnamed protein product [Calicophoron daubneyi]|uniref:Alpha-1,3-mannosyl-glycoprotein 2-beta-N-acetylglucosaminyltransferase n=1 Tax=Calicophoron daubneyi TaxID=300641 RepID=A0AAV2TKF8_CALDB